MIRFGFTLEADDMNLIPTPGHFWPLSTLLLTLPKGGGTVTTEEWGTSQQVVRLPLPLPRGAPSLQEPAFSLGPAPWSDLRAPPLGAALGQCCWPLGSQPPSGVQS